VEESVLAEPVARTRQARRAFQVTAIQNEAAHVRLSKLGRQAVAERATRMRESIASVMRTIRRTLRRPKRPNPG
jgi:hypothetical protein